ncbi:hypothetical protein Tdes44962_MAKER07753 [Teratosphaeria destructans]|uniref:Uncharacterized protein n=1 Tax=Teratosphaeria destructans TaxID=418781 RepID=A0A9W7W5W3_9PEZI|nr:hypothetical protein Tdes44962_MAKER07753 [Teratosphaeria destructans]
MPTFQPPQHGHSGSDASSRSSNGSAYQLILDHILTYPGTFEIPLRTMYTLNSATRPPGSPQSSAGGSPLQAQGAFPDQTATQSLGESLMAQLSQLPNQANFLPPSFITSFLRRCFPAELVCVDFPQALTGLDYLKDLETRRRREVAAAMARLEIDRDTLDNDAAALSEQYPGVLKWVKSIEEKERKIDALYTQLYVALRRWIMINELSLLPFNKHNCVAMLNTLYPPAISNPPTTKLTPAVLQAQRDGFFKYICKVEKSSPRILQNLMQQGKAPTDDNGWIAVTRTLGLYLQLANSMINESTDIVHVQDVSPRKVHGSGEARRAKADSGVSFTSDRPSTRSSSTAEQVSPIEPPSRPKTPSGGRSGTALEKLARGLRTIGRSRTDVTEMIHNDAPMQPGVEKPKMLKKMRSLGSIESRKVQGSAFQSNAAPTFDADAMRLQRMKYEAGINAQQKFGSRAQPFEL